MGRVSAGSSGRDHLQGGGQARVQRGVLGDGVEPAQLGQVVVLDLAKVHVLGQVTATLDQVGTDLAPDLDGVHGRGGVLAG